MLTLFVVSVINTALCISLTSRNLATNLIRPLVVILFFSSIRANLFTTARDLYQSLTIIGFILMYTFFMAMVGYYLFRGS